MVIERSMVIEHGNGNDVLLDSCFESWVLRENQQWTDLVSPVAGREPPQNGERPASCSPEVHPVYWNDALPAEERQATQQKVLPDATVATNSG